MDKNQLWNALLKAEKKTLSGKFKKLLRIPFQYTGLMMFNHFWYPLTKRGVYFITKTFFGRPFRTLLPSGTDIVLNGIKSHDSEIRLTKYFAANLNVGDIVIDVGAHYGYYSLLASELVGNKGKVYSIEASAFSYRDLSENVASYSNIKTFHAAAGDQNGTITFYEYPGPYAEYNTIVKGAYTDQPWYRRVKETINTVPVIVLDHLIHEAGIEKVFIKIDVEGGEATVLKGLDQSLQTKQLIISMEYLWAAEKHNPHRQATQFLYQKQYHSFSISADGSIRSVENIDQYLQDSGQISDNIIFIKN